MRRHPRLSIIVVTYNSQAVIANCLNYIRKQSYSSYEVIVVDNASSDKTLELLSKYSWIKLIRNIENLGFSKANNQGVEQAKGEFILLLNPDAFLSDSALDILVNSMKSDFSLGFVCPKLLKPNNKNIIDSTGIQATPERRFFDRGRGEVDHHQYDSQTDIFAGCGAALLLRKTALDDIKIGNEYLDNDFFAYFEDVDLCWRMRLRGWKGLYCPKAIVYHQRGQDIDDYEKQPLFAFLKKRLSQWGDKRTRKIRSLVFINSLLILIKNASFLELSRNIISLFSYWFRRILYLLFIESYVFFPLLSHTRRLFLILKKRFYIRKRLLIEDKDLRRYFS